MLDQRERELLRKRDEVFEAVRIAQEKQKAEEEAAAKAAAATTLYSLALEALRKYLLQPTETSPRISLSTLSFCALPTAAVSSLLASCVEALPEVVTPLNPPIELLRIFYGAHIEELTLTGLTDTIAAETFGGGLHSIESLSLPLCKLTAFGCGHLAVSLARELVELSVFNCPLFDAACLAQICRCTNLRQLRLVECALLALEEDVGSVEPLRSLTNLTALDLGGNQLGADAASAICSIFGERTAPNASCLTSLELWGSDADDNTALAIMALTSLKTLNLSWTSITDEGMQAVVLGLGRSNLTALDMSNAAKLEMGSCAACLDGAPLLTSLSLAGLQLDADDLSAALRLPELTSLNLHAARLEGGARRRDALRQVVFAQKLQVLRLDHLKGSAPWSVGRSPMTPEELNQDIAKLLELPQLEAGRHRGVALVELRASECVFFKEHASFAKLWLQLSIVSLQRLEMSGCPPLRAVFQQVASMPQRGGWARLERIDAAMTKADDTLPTDLGRLGAPLQHIDLSGNPDITEHHLLLMTSLQPTLHTIVLRYMPRLTARSVGIIFEDRLFENLRKVDVDGTAIGEADRAKIGANVIAAKAAKRAEAMLARFRDATPDETAAASSVTRYDAATMRSLRASPFAQLPPRPLPVLPGILQAP